MSVLNDIVHPVSGKRFNVRRVLSAVNAKADDFIACDTTTAAFTVTLPSGAAVGTAVMVGDDALVAGTNAITIAAADLIDGLASVTIGANGARLMFVFDGTTWKRSLFQRLVRTAQGGYLAILDGETASTAAPPAAPGAAGNVLMSNGVSWQSVALSTGWTTLLDLDFTAQANQTLTGDGNFTIAGKVWQKSNSANEAAAMAIVSGTGLNIKAHTGAYGAVRTAPLIWLPFSQIAPASSFTLMSGMRFWLYADVAGAPGNGDTLFLGVDTNSNDYKVWQHWNFPIGVPTLQLTSGRALAGTQFNATTSGGAGNQDINTTKMIELHTAPIFPIGASAPWLAKAADAAAGWPDEQTGLTPIIADNATTAPALSGVAFTPPINLLTGFGIVLGAGGTTADPTYTVKRIRVDYRP